MFNAPLQAFTSNAASPTAISPEGVSRLLVRTDHDAGLIRVEGCGRWSIEECDRHFGELKRELAVLRKAARPVRVLVDLRRAAEQAAATALRIGYWTSRIYQPEDRAAVLVSSCLVKQQLQQNAGIHRSQIFTSDAAARLWLFAYD